MGAFTFRAVLRLSVDDQTEYRRGSASTIYVDNITMLHFVKIACATDAHMYGLVGQLVWSRPEANFALNMSVGYPRRVTQARAP